MERNSYLKHDRKNAEFRTFTFIDLYPVLLLPCIMDRCNHSEYVYSTPKMDVIGEYYSERICINCTKKLSGKLKWGS